VAPRLAFGEVASRGRANWSRYLDPVFSRAQVKTTLDRFRDTFAISLLENGPSTENVFRASYYSVTSQFAITERQCEPWVKTLQKKLEEEVRKAWSK
jgi:hypothetical protein